MVMEAETSTAFHTNVTLLDKFRLGIEIINDSCNLGLLVGRGCWETCFFIRGQIAKSGTDLTGQAVQPLGLKLDPERSGQANQGMLAADEYWLHLVGR